MSSAETLSPEVEDLTKKADEVNLSEEKAEEVPKHPLFEMAERNDLTGISELLNTGEVAVDMVDEHGMTTLMHAAYRGNKELCQLLIDRGADTMAGCHGNGYTSLHFAGLSGNLPVVALLLQNGARSYVTNSVGRTASQMAAFVSHHHISSFINTFIPKSDVEYFSVARGTETTPKLNPLCVGPLYNLLTQINFHPVKIAMTLKKNPILLEHLSQLVKVTSLISENEIKRGNEGNEIVAIKVHIISYILDSIRKRIATESIKLCPVMEEEGNADKSSKDPLDMFIRSMLRVKTVGGISEGLDTLLRESVRSFPFIETTILHQLVANLTQVKLCEDPGAWGVINTVVNGQKGFRDLEPCSSCGEERSAKKCARCSYDAYCNQECQKLHWFIHKKYCKEKEKEKNEKSN